jgi:glycosyltransferase involved in cell wall biosynthesis
VSSPVAERWLVAGIPRITRSGGSLRAAHLWRTLAERTAAATPAAFGRRGLLSLATAIAVESRLWRRPVQVASTQLIPGAGLRLLRASVRARALDLHDHPRLQSEAFGLVLSAIRGRALNVLVDRNVSVFERLIVPSASFAELCDLPNEKVVVITNGADTAHILPAPAPGNPVVAMVSGAAPGRGIDLLVDAVAAVRTEVPDATLRLALTATGPASLAYLHEVTRQLSDRSWVSVESVPYLSLPLFLGEAAVLAVPHPKNDYMDAATPVKLFDSMAAGRPVVVTPRHETARIVTSCSAGLVARSDHVDDFAGAITRLLHDQSLRRELGANARRCAVERYDWSVLASRLADALLMPQAASIANGPQNASR